MKPQARRKARSLALQAIYQWQLVADDVVNIKMQFVDKINSKKVDAEYFNDLLDGVIKNVGAIDEVITPLLDRKITDLDAVELAVLRLATYELMLRLDVPYKVVINEALELTKNFGSIEGYKYINGVLDKVARQLRTDKKS
ncbi:MAG: transcriptional terminator NusB [uncultured bacterium]|nr:MAG: transcriptional terminator NusB [uncultured bacterium]OGT08673.1 MAG: N utilization substance protein B [Gammaproteobacteria bacterium RBG_16_37_9]HBC71654.1 transcription antitermination factor NusB [Coxiellaceae bacterium]HBS51641.1 transcription antitermination factor NusB [Coxiellaceae bacterium]HBY55838.1 transcription antitermination factor NusB [Coxiellaceae bacterium]